MYGAQEHKCTVHKNINLYTSPLQMPTSGLYLIKFQSIVVTTYAFSFNNKSIFILPTSYVYIFWVILTINNKCFLKQEKKFIFFVDEAMCASCETGFQFINISLI
jgi:hypothetical protein